MQVPSALALKVVIKEEADKMPICPWAFASLVLLTYLSINDRSMSDDFLVTISQHIKVVIKFL